LKKISLTIFTNNFITTLLGISSHEIWEKKKRSLFHIGSGADIRPQIRSRKITDDINEIFLKMALNTSKKN
jgi:hypothetical protein